MVFYGPFGTYRAGAKNTVESGERAVEGGGGNHTLPRVTLGSSSVVAGKDGAADLRGVFKHQKGAPLSEAAAL